MWSTGMYEEYCTVKRGEMVLQLEDPWASSATAVACGRFATGELGFARSGRDVLGRFLQRHRHELALHRTSPRIVQAHHAVETASGQCGAIGAERHSVDSS